MSIVLRELLTAVNTKEVYGNTNLNVEKIEYHSSKITGDDLFVAIKGYKTDGHDFVCHAVKNGASCIVAEKDFDFRVQAKVLVKDSRLALAQLADKFYGSPSRKLQVVGITGTNGKTTVSYLLRSILETKDEEIGLIGTIAHYLGKQRIPAQNTTPESLDLQRMFDEMLTSGIRYVVMEVSSHSLALKRVESIDFDVAIFTNLTQDHLDFHQDMESYRKTKGRLFEMLDEKESKAVINLDDSNWEYFYNKAKASKITYSLKNKKADVFTEKVESSLDGLKMCIFTPKGEFDIETRLIGEQNVYNTLAAVAGSLALQFDLRSIARGLKDAERIPGRLERIDLGQIFSVLIDYAHTPDALEKTLLTAKGFSSGKLIALFGCGGDRDKTKRSIMGRLASRIADYVIVTSDNPRSENQSLIIDDIFKGITRKSNVQRIEDRAQAIEKALGLAKPKDIVVIAGKGHEDYQVIGTNRIHFSDKEIVERILRQMGYGTND